MKPIPAVVIIRDPDADNEVFTFGGPVLVHDIDLGRAALNNPEEYADWAASHRAVAADMRRWGYPEVAELIESTVANHDPEETP